MRSILLSIIVFSVAFSVSGQSINDTLTVKQNSIIFYSITQLEFDTLARSDSDDGLNEMISDFEYYVGNLLEILQKDKSKYVLFTAHRYFRIENETESIIYDRKDSKYLVGMIINGRSKFEIVKGVWTDVEMIQMINEFFNKE